MAAYPPTASAVLASATSAQVGQQETPAERSFTSEILGGLCYELLGGTEKHTIR
jgi:hypothetical protein